MTPRAPISLLCELTYRCNLQCPYCFNPLDLGSPRDELERAAWLNVVDQAAALGVVQFGFSGGEPTLRGDDLVALVERASRRGGYTNLITQGTFLDDALLDAHQRVVRDRRIRLRPQRVCVPCRQGHAQNPVVSGR